MKRSLCAFIIASFAITTGYCFADDIWTINTVTYRQSGQPSVTVDMNNNPVMAFTGLCYPYTYSTLYTAAQTNTGYLVEQVGSVSDAAWPKIAFTSNNELAMVFLRGSNNLWYASKSDWFDWSYWQIDSLQAGYIDMSLTNNDIPHLAYTARSVSIEHAFFDVHSQQWSKETLSGFGSPISGYARIDSDRSGKIVVCCCSRDVKTLCAVYSNGSWEYPPAINSAKYPDCGFTADGLPAVAYTKANILCYAVYINSAVGWIETQVAPASSSFLMTSLNHSSTGIPGIAYINDGKLMYATNIAGGWTITEIDTLSSIPYSSFDLIFDKNDKPLIAYNGADTRFGWNLSAIKLAGIGLANMDNTFDISGTITNHATGLPIANASVQWRNQNLGVNAIITTDVNGFYKFDDMPPGLIDVYVSADSYAPAGASNLTLDANICNLDFALMPYATLSGKVLDNTTAQPIPNITIEYNNDKYQNWVTTATDANGNFSLTNLWPGVAEVKAMPDINTGYAWNLPWGSNFISLNEGENRSEQIIALEKGALVSGYIKDANSNAFSGIEYYYTGKKCEGWGSPDVNGFYQIRLPIGTSCIEPDDKNFGVLPLRITITDVNDDVNVPDIVIYTEETGGQISGDINNPSGYGKTGVFYVIAFKAGTRVDDPNIWYTLQPVSENEMENAGAFSLAHLPPDANYDIYLCTNNYPTDIESLAVQDVVLNVTAGTTGINLEYNSEGSTVKGSVKNTNDQPVLGASVFLSDSLNIFRGFGQVDSNGLYIIYNVPVGTYTATAMHSKYLPVSITITVVTDGAIVDVNDIVIPFEGSKEGPDLNGNGVIDLFDIAEFSGQWLEAGTNGADFNQDAIVNFFDWLPIADNWLWKAIWLND